MKIKGETDDRAVRLGDQALEGWVVAGELGGEDRGCNLDGVRLALVGGEGDDEAVDLRGVFGGRGSQGDRHDGTVA